MGDEVSDESVLLSRNLTGDEGGGMVEREERERGEREGSSFRFAFCFPSLLSSIRDDEGK